ncbi:hypothetical protein [Azospirillum argentinense]|nr:hypothetical protein [Azospirillum argentinense]
MRLKDIPYERLPLNADIHGELRDRIDVMAIAFDRLGHTDLAREMDAVRAALYRAWNAVEAKRRAEADSGI